MSASEQPDRIYLSAPDVGNEERDALLRAFDSGWIAPVGPELDALEAELAAMVQADAAVAVSSGTGALRLALALHDIGPGDEVVVASATFAASAFAVAHSGATPVFCDSDESTWCLDPFALEEFLAARAAAGRLPAAVMPVSLYGSAPNYAELMRVCGEYDVPIIEDSAEALGSVSDHGPVGSLPHPAVFSFNGNKITTSSSGGAFVGTQAQCDRVRFLSTQARQPALHYEHHDIGFNFRLSNLLAAVGRAQLGRLPGIMERLAAINARYRSEFPDFDWCPYAHTPQPNHWLSVALLPAEIDPVSICERLAAQNIECRPAWKPMHQQPVFADSEMIGGAIADDLYVRGLCLPSGSSMTADQLDRVVVALKQAIE